MFHPTPLVEKHKEPLCLRKESRYDKVERGLEKWGGGGAGKMLSDFWNASERFEMDKQRKAS